MWNKCWIPGFWRNTKENMYLLLVFWFFPYFLSVKLFYLDKVILEIHWILVSDHELSAMTLISLNEHLQTEWKLCEHKAGGSSSLWSFKCYLGLTWLVGNLGFMLFLSLCDLIFANLLFFFSGAKSFPAIFVSSGGLGIYK